MRFFELVAFESSAEDEARSQARANSKSQWTYHPCRRTTHRPSAAPASCQDRTPVVARQEVCDEADLLGLLLAHSIVRHVRTIEVEVRPLGGDSFKVALDAKLL
jgi:hypothetical protein